MLDITSGLHAQGRPNWRYFSGIWEDDGTNSFQFTTGRAGFFLALAQPKSLMWLQAIHEVFQLGTVQVRAPAACPPMHMLVHIVCGTPLRRNSMSVMAGLGMLQAGGASQNASLQIRSKEHVTAFLRHYIPNGHFKLQKVLTLATLEFSVPMRPLLLLTRLDPEQPNPKKALGQGLAGAYTTKERKSARSAAERKELNEPDRFLANQWVALLKHPSDRASWSH